MSGLSHIEQNVKDAFISGEPGTTGREPFEDSSASGPGRNFVAGAGHKFDHEHTGDNCNHASHGQGLTGALAGNHNNNVSGQHHSTGALAGAGTGVGVGSTHHHDNNNNQQQHGIVDKLTAGSGHAHSHEHTGAGTGAGVGGLGGGMTGAVPHRDHHDRVGHVGQESNKYEGDLHSGPRTGGAAGTDRFDSDRTGAPGNVGAGLDRKHDDGVQHDTSQRAPGQGTGGLSGLLTTTDKEFTGRDRKGEGAYADTDGPYERNETGPAGNSALTGREGNLENNPVAKAKSHDTHNTGAHAGQTTSSTTNNAAGEEHKEGFLAKVKHAVGV